jgi:hypothetical protein
VNPAQLHLMVNHVPVIGAILAAGLLGYGVFTKGTDLSRVALGLFVLMAVAGIAVYLTGEPAEELVEQLAGVSETSLHQHEDAALVATMLLGAYGLFAAGLLVMYRQRGATLPSRVAMLAFALSLVPVASMGYTANLGGHIRHAELGDGAPAFEALAGSEELLPPPALPRSQTVDF